MNAERRGIVGLWHTYIFDGSDPAEILSDCTLSFPDIRFIVGGSVVQIKKEDYVKDVSKAQDRSECGLALRRHDAPFNIIGTPMFLDYYVTHSWKDGKMFVQPHSESTKGQIPTITPLPTSVIEAATIKVPARPAYWWTWNFFILYPFTLWYLGLQHGRN